MQLSITFDAGGPVVLPVHYAQMIQGLIYRQLENPALRNYLHEHGFALEKRRFKLFTFSRLFGSEVHYDKSTKSLLISPPLKLVVCSPVNFIMQELGTGFLRRGSVRLGNARLEVAGVTAETPIVTGDTLVVRMLSPLVAYSTLEGVDGRKYTYYYSPFEPRFEELVAANLFKKHLLIYGRSADPKSFSIRPVKVEDRDLKVTRYKDTVVKGWMGRYALSGDPLLLQTALDAGMGSKNSQGYGCCILEDTKTGR